MAKFCTKCGKALKDGKPCSCEKEEKMESVSENFIDNIIDIFKNIMIKPIDTIKKYQNTSDKKLGMTLVIIHLIIAGLFCYFLMSNTMKGITGDINSKLQGMSSIGSLMGESAEFRALETAAVPFMSTFFSGAFGAVIQYVFLSLMATLFVSVIFKAKAKIGEFFQLHAITLPVYSIVMVVATLLSFISYKLGAVIAIFGVLFYFVCLVQGYIELLKAKEDKVSYAVSLSITTTYIISIIISFIIVAIMVASNNPYY